LWISSLAAYNLTMYYYLSFLRPPPTSSAPNTNGSSTISITPQIANDLRTEFLTSTQDIYYRWLRSSPAPITASPPVKLTTWRGEASAYKTISVILPQGVRENDSWRLVLTTSPSDPGVITLGTANAPQKALLPYPVASLPISFTSRSNDIIKQEQVERRYAIYLDTAPMMMVIREHTSFDLDKVG
jgi:protein N-lysine methyltransferase METTL21D